MLRAAAVTLAILVATGCSGDELPTSPGSDRVPAEVVRDGLAALFAGDHAGQREEDAARCFAEELTDRVPLSALREAGVLDDRDRVVADVPPLPEDLAADWADAQLACTDFVAESARAQVRLSKGRIDRDAYARCLRAGLSDQQVHAAVAASLAGRWDSPDLALLAEAQGACRREATPPDEDPG